MLEMENDFPDEAGIALAGMTIKVFAGLVR
jgi:hypothetical protein